MQQTLKTFDQAIAVGNLDAYTHWVNQIPMLSEAEEQQLARQWREEEDYDAAKRLVMSHLRFVVRVARGYSGYGLALGDLIQEGNIGLMKAVKRFDPTVGVRLVSFAVHWVKAEIHEFVIKNWRIVKVATTKAQRKLFFNLRSAKKRLGWFSSEEVNAVADDLGVTAKDVLEMEARLNARDAGFDLQDGDDDDGSSSRTVSPCQYLTDASMDPAVLFENDTQDQSGKAQLYRALSQLDERSQDILAARWLADSKATLHDLAAKYGVSAERIRQLEKQAMNKLKAQINLT